MVEEKCSIFQGTEMIVWDFLKKQEVLIRENDCFATSANKLLAGLCLLLVLLITVRFERLN